MILRYGGIDYPVPFPEYGYSTNITINMEKLDPSNNNLVWYDHGAANDFRITEFNFKVNDSDNRELINLFDKANRARLDDISIVCSTKQYLYPFSPDLGNNGAFVASIVSTSPSTMLMHPWRYYDYSVSMVMVSNPSYSFGPDKSEGSLVIGSVTRLPRPDITLNTNRNYNTTLTNDGTIARVDHLESEDYQIASFSFTSRLEKAQRLINYLVATARGNSFSIISPGGGYLFGTEGGSSGIYSVILESNIVSVRHVKPDKFEVSFTVRRKI